MTQCAWVPQLSMLWKCVALLLMNVAALSPLAQLERVADLWQRAEFFQMLCSCELRPSLSVAMTSNTDRHIPPVSTPPAPKINLWLSFHIEPLKTVWIVCFPVLKVQESSHLQHFPLLFHKHNWIHCESLLWWHFSALLWFLWAQPYIFPSVPFTCIKMSWEMESPVNLHVFLSNNAERRENFNSLRHHAGLFGVNRSSQQQQASLISQDPLQSVLWKRQ